MSTIDNIWQKFKGNGKVYNYTQKWIWVLETTTNHPKGPALAHKLAPRTKAPIKIDNAVLVQPKNGEPYLRALPDPKTGNNFLSMVT